MTVYFTEEVRKSYPYGERGTVHGYIAPAAWATDHNAIRRMIGYSGPILVLDSKGRVL